VGACACGSSPFKVHNLRPGASVISGPGCFFDALAFMWRKAAEPINSAKWIFENPSQANSNSLLCQAVGQPVLV